MSKQVFHFLYIDSNYISRDEITKWLSQNSLKYHENYQVKVTTCANFKEAMKRLLRHNYDSEAKEKIKENYGIDLVPFNSIIFEVKSNMSNKKDNWEYLVRNIQLMKFSQLGLTNGLIVFGNQTRFSPSTLETLMSFNVAKIFYTPFTFEQIDTVISSYLNNIHGATSLSNETRIEQGSEPNKEIVRRFIRIYDEERQAKIALPLDSLEYDSSTFITRILDESFDIPQEEDALYLTDP